MSLITILTFVKKTKENDDAYTFSFSALRKLSHRAGQHGIFMLPGLYRPHPFSLSSAPEEELITFTTHTGSGSAFKRRIMNFKPGAKIIFLGPVLNFTLVKTKRRHVFLAQGIGITPFRSMLVHTREAKLSVTTTLIHVDSNEHTFRDETAEYATNATYPTNPIDFQTAVKKQSPSQMFYLSGSPRFVSGTKKLLINMGVARHSIKTDSFLGY